MREAGFPVEKDSYADNTYVVSFPIHEKDFDRSKDEVSIWEQMHNAASLQKYWADNQVSITVTFRPDERDQIKRVLDCFQDGLKSVSFLMSDPSVVYPQAPYIKITKEEFDGIRNKIQSFEFSSETSTHERDDAFCDGDTCELPQ